MPQVPVSCPLGFPGRYTVVPGDTLFTIAQRLRISLNTLIAANPHITNPNLINPGDVLCVPRQLIFPCAVVLSPRVSTLPGTIGSALIHFDISGAEAVGVLAKLPPPATFGDYDVFLATVYIPDIGGLGDQLFLTEENSSTYANSISLPTAATLTPESRVVVEAYKNGSGVSGPVIMEGFLKQCRA